MMRRRIRLPLNARFFRIITSWRLPRSLVHLSSVPDASGHFGAYGGVFVPETLIFALQQLEAEYRRAQADPEFHQRI